MAQAARTLSKVQYAYDTIKQRMLDGTYGPGVRLVLDQLARSLSVSPVPIREAIRRLEAEGWVVFTQNVGAQVASIDFTQYQAAMEALALIEGYATAQAVPHLDGDALARARTVNDKLRASLGSFDPLSFTQLNHEFHAILCQPCPNLHLRALLEREWQRMDLLRRSTFSQVPGRAQASVDEHETLLQLIGSGASPEVIEGYSRQHKLNTLRALATRSAPAVTAPDETSEPD
ncbi:MAG: GntR family transcriptional regulator [Acidimicrobiales bacterium]